MDIVAITVSVNYSDILKHMIDQNSKFFKVWYIVTSPEDKDTTRLIEEKNKPNIKVLLYTDFYTRSKFNKGGAIKFAQEYLDKHHKSANILLLDSDIYLPDLFMSTLPKELESNTLYGVSGRSDYYTLADFIHNTNPIRYAHQMSFVGFFQLYKESSFKYKDSQNCSECDNAFREMFSRRKLLKLHVKHLGKPNVNWNGRKYEEGSF